MEDSAVVGVLGLGRMGGVIAAHVAKGGFAVQAYDPVAEPDRFRSLGVELRENEAAAVRDADVVLIIVGYDEEVKDILLASDVLRSCRPGQLMVIMSTVRPITVSNIAEALPEGVSVVDAPVCRGPEAADRGELLALVGGDVEDVKKCIPVLRTFCTDVEHLGSLGAGQVAKMANNLMLWTTYFGVFEGMRLMRASGVDAERGRQALLRSSANSWALSTWPDIRPVWAHDDLAIAEQVASEVGVDAPVLASVAKAFDRWPDPTKFYEAGKEEGP